MTFVTGHERRAWKRCLVLNGYELIMVSYFSTFFDRNDEHIISSKQRTLAGHSFHSPESISGTHVTANTDGAGASTGTGI